MISDILSESVDEIRRYLGDEPLSGAYRGPIRRRIEILVEEMDSVRRELDTPPPIDKEKP